MKFVKLHNNGLEVLVNLCAVTEVYKSRGRDGSIVYFRGGQPNLNVDESIDEILYLSKQADEILYSAKNAEINTTAGAFCRSD